MDSISHAGRDKQHAAILHAVLTLAVALLFSLFFYTCNTPLGPAVGSDNAMYLTMGTALAKGYAPYTDIFDHKGPLLFIVQAVPQLLSSGYSTLAVFIQETVFLWLSLMIVSRIARRAGAPAFLVQLIYLAVYAPLVSGGNLTEEYANFFTLAGLEVMTAVFDGEDGIPDGMRLFAPAALMGAAAMGCFMLRANNMLPLAGAVCALALYLLVRRQWTRLLPCMGGFLAGCAAVLVPIALWLAAHGALKAGIYGALIHNMMYAETNGASRVAMLLHNGYGHYALLLALIACLGAGAYVLRRRRLPVALAMIAGAAGGGLAAFISHKFYTHYLMLGVPVAALGAAQLFGLLERRRTVLRWLPRCAVAALCAAVLMNCGLRENRQREKDARAMAALTPNAVALYAQVPPEDRDRFMAYRVEPKWYVATKALPCMRFYFLQEILAEADPAVMDEIVATLESDPPLWVVIFYQREFGPPYDPRVQAIFDTRYEFVDAKGQYQLLRLKETP